MGEKRRVGSFLDNVQLAVRQMAVQIFAHARRRDAVFAAEYQQRRCGDLGQKSARIGSGHGIKRGLQRGGCAVLHNIGQYFFQNRLLVFGV